MTKIDIRAAAAHGKARVRIDWEAIERDYRTGKFTLRELESKHGAGYAEISRRAKRDGWTKDLAEAVKLATSAALIKEVTTKATTEAQHNTKSVVLAAAELNKQVILQHRGDLKEARDVAFDLLVELKHGALLASEMELLAQIVAGEGAEPKDEAEARRVVAKAIGIGSRVACVRALSDALTKLQGAERKAFGLDDDGAPDESDRAAALKRARERAAQR